MAPLSAIPIRFFYDSSTYFFPYFLNFCSLFLGEIAPHSSLPPQIVFTDRFQPRAHRNFKDC